MVLSVLGPPPLRESPDPSSRTLGPTQLVSHGFPSLRPYVRLPRKGGYPHTKWELSLLTRIFQRHQHLPLGCQPRSPECSTNVTLRPRRTLPDSFPDSTPLICVLPTITTPHPEGYLSTHRHYSFTAALYTQCVRANDRLDTQNTSNSARSHYNIKSDIAINLIL